MWVVVWVWVACGVCAAQGFTALGRLCCYLYIEALVFNLWPVVPSPHINPGVS